MKSKKFMLAGLLAMAGSLILASCGKGASSDASSNPADSSASSQDVASSNVDSDLSSAEDVTSASEEESQPNYPTKVKITQPGILIVGTSFDARDYITSTPEDARDFILTSDDTDVAVVGEDGYTISIIASGSTRIRVQVPNGANLRNLGNIKIEAMSEDGKAIQEIADTISNRFRADYIWKDFSGQTTSNITGGEATSVDLGTMILTPDYVLDWFFGQYSGLRLDFDDNYYNYAFLDAEGEEVIPDPDAGDKTVADTLARAKSVEILERTSAAYVTQYFPIDGLLNIADWDEVTADSGDHYFVLDDNDASLTQFGAIYGATFSGLSNGTTKLWLDEETNNLCFQFVFDYFDSREAANVLNVIDVTLSYGEGSSFALLDEAVKTAEPPAPADLSSLADDFSAYSTVGMIDFEIGLFDRELNPLYGETLTKANIDHSMNTIGTVVLNDGAAAWVSADRDYLTGEVDEDTIDYGGFMVDSVNGGVYFLDPSVKEEGVEGSVDGLIVKDETPVSNSSDIKAWSGVGGARAGLGLFCTDLINKAVLDGASLIDLGDGVYKYDATFDDCYLGSLFESLAPYSYGDFFVAENAQYVESYIFVNEDKSIDVVLMMRIGLDQGDGKSLSCYQGLIATLYSPGEAPTITVGEPFADLFAA
ncbi:MAG: hypothetical protein J6328_01525 [Bacilli bacterium]|nr:hypothetical protein [Bacilli bacterium]